MIGVEDAEIDKRVSKLGLSTRRHQYKVFTCLSPVLSMVISPVPGRWGSLFASKSIASRESVGHIVQSSNLLQNCYCVAYCYFKMRSREALAAAKCRLEL